ncbi:mannose-6-phosphate isomerase, class I [Danxiaibacter flavus]|uniref:mannose-6-phosphate isomerase n=1 Tax=Danxiaibacter flavus TaxID=3049108 RepID=A0ABV3ZNQ4_9BACT|nr:mannose-6-phosphate isomerase, class I [Chitinophagaceae bacterium DXS]
MSFLQDKIFKLKGKVQHYAWGGFSYIPSWLGEENKDNKPYAEYWMGAHPSAPSEIQTPNGTLSLDVLIKDYPEEFIGEKVQKQFGELPYLFKILDVHEMLSIQVHPTKEEAEKGFAAEETVGVPLNAPNRNYKDKNHKPEVMVALSEFWLLHGFKPKDELMITLKTIAEFAELEELFLEKSYKGLYQHVMELPQDKVDEILRPLVEKELKRKASGDLSKDEPGWWVCKLFDGKEDSISSIDRGVFSIYFFNIVKAEQGEAVFQGAGIPHAYLEGQNVELMANSDNVLRGGLTPKHVDVPELLKHTTFQGIDPHLMKGKDTNGEKVYNCPVPDFGISKIELSGDQTYSGKASSLEIIVVIDGELTVAGANSVEAKKGEALAILQGESYTISTGSRVLAYKAFVP